MAKKLHILAATFDETFLGGWLLVDGSVVLFVVCIVLFVGYEFVLLFTL